MVGSEFNIHESGGRVNSSHNVAGEGWLVFCILLYCIQVFI